MLDFDSPAIKDRIALAKEYSDEIKAISSSYQVELNKVWSKYRMLIHKAVNNGGSAEPVIDAMIEELYHLLDELLDKSILTACKREDVNTDFYFATIPLSVEQATLDYYKGAISDYRNILLQEISFAIDNGYSFDMNLFLFNPTAYMANKKNGLERLKEGIGGVSKGFAYAFGDNMKKLGISMAALAYTNSLMELWKVNGGVAAYFGVRNSNYPCALCDSYAHQIIPLSQGMIYPLHNRCVCSVIQIYQNELT